MVDALLTALVVCLLVLLLVAIIVLVFRFLAKRLHTSADTVELVESLLWLLAAVVCVVVLARALLGRVV